MAVREEIQAVAADPARTPEQKRAAIADLKARNLRDEWQRYVGRSFTLNGIRWTLHELSIDEQSGLPLVRAVLSARVAPNGAVLLTREDERNPFYWLNPPVLVVTGSEPNPDYDASLPGSGATRPTYTEDRMAVAAALLAQVRLG